MRPCTATGIVPLGGGTVATLVRQRVRWLVTPLSQICSLCIMLEGQARPEILDGQVDLKKIRATGLKPSGL
jgi:hypothetical protein